MGTKWRITQNPIFTFFGRIIHVPHCTDQREETEWRQEIVQMSSLYFWFSPKELPHTFLCLRQYLHSESILYPSKTAASPQRSYKRSWVISPVFHRHYPWNGDDSQTCIPSPELHVLPPITHIHLTNAWHSKTNTKPRSHKSATS